MQFILLLPILFAAVSMRNIEEDTYIRKTQYGLIKGTRSSSKADPGVDFYSFQGVPYAKPPVGKLRFQEPVPPEKWDGIKDTVTSAKTCPQMNQDVTNPDVVGSEDCLYLNIYEPITARKSNGLLPVMVWIHGGTFVFGSIDGSGPDYLMEKPIVLVQVEYRVNVFGFLSTKDKYAEGNSGLKDQTFALKWVRDNIENFGGDPNKVTIFGESAGSASVLYHMLSKKSKGLFHQAIGQSGATLNRWALQQDPVKMVQRLARGLGIQEKDSGSIIRKLQEVNYETLIKAAFNQSVVGFFTPYYVQPFAPIIEKNSPTSFISESTFRLLESGQFAKVPYLVGINSEEGSFGYFYIDNGQTDINIYKSNPGLIIPISMNINPQSKCYNLTIEKIRNFYFDNGSFTDKANWINYMSEELFVRGIRRTVEFLYGRIPMYTYRFSYAGSHQSSYLGGVGHHEEVQYIFYEPVNGEPSETTEQDKLVRKRVVTLWTNFAITGNPTPETDELLQNINWPETYPTRSLLDIGTNLKVEEVLKSKDGEFWDHLFELCGNPPYFLY